MTSPHVNTRSFVLKHILRHIKGVSLHSHKFRSTPINAVAVYASAQNAKDLVATVNLLQVYIEIFRYLTITPYMLISTRAISCDIST